MIRLDNIGKQNGKQILFIEASAALNKGEKIGLVGPNGAGKTTLFRLIIGDEQPDEGQVSVDRGITIGYFSQDVGEMAGRSAVVGGDGRRRAGQRGGGRTEGTRSRDGRPGTGRRARGAGRALRRGAAQLRGTRRLRARRPGTRNPRRTGLQPGDDGRRCRRAVGRLEDARRARPHPADASRRHAARRAEQPSRSRKPDLAGGVPQGLSRRAADDLARPRVHEPHRRQGDRDRRRGADHLLGQLRILRAAARARREAAAGAVRAPAGDARQGDQVHRAVQGARLPCRAGAEPGEEARQDRAGRAAPAPPDRRVRIPAGAAFGRGRGQPEEGAQGLRQPRHLRRPRLHGPPQGALVRHGRQRRRQVDAAAGWWPARRRRTTAR